MLKRYTKWNRLLLRRTALLRQFGDYERDLDRAAQTFQRDLLCGIATDVAVITNSKQPGSRSAEISAFFFSSAGVRDNPRVGVKVEVRN
ncbi:hypothetical protein BDZ89DRAFT_684851 [Hymenopellis radicata]|nr:hypothetical protein BDZ89DRAFT_684851 [Hymenopellis radicata]